MILLPLSELPSHLGPRLPREPLPSWITKRRVMTARPRLCGGPPDSRPDADMDCCDAKRDSFPTHILESGRTKAVAQFGG